MTWPKKSNPIENVLSFIMVHGGVDRHDRMLDVYWMRDVIAAAENVANESDRGRAGDRFHQALDDLKLTLHGSK